MLNIRQVLGILGQDIVLIGTIIPIGMDMNQHGLEPSLPGNSQCLVSNNLLKGDQSHIRKEALLILALI